jgi:hypothetical protein
VRTTHSTLPIECNGAPDLIGARVWYVSERYRVERADVVARDGSKYRIITDSERACVDALNIPGLGCSSILVESFYLYHNEDDALRFASAMLRGQVDLIEGRLEEIESEGVVSERRAA